MNKVIHNLTKIHNSILLYFSQNNSILIDISKCFPGNYVIPRVSAT